MNNQEYDKQSEQIISMLTPSIEVKPSADLRNRILNATEKQRAQQKPRRRSPIYWLGPIASVAAVIAIVITLTLNTPAYAARKYFSNAIIAASDMKTMVMKARVRTLPKEPINNIDPRQDFIPTTAKVIYDEPMKWCIEKENGRTLLYCGEEENNGMICDWVQGWAMGWYHDPATFVEPDLAVMLDPRLLLDAEQRAIGNRLGYKYDIQESDLTVNVRVTTPAMGDYSESDYMLNSSLLEANTVREYTFDKESGRLQNLRISVVVSPEEQVTVIESDSIVYDCELDTATLTDQDYSHIEFVGHDIPTIGTEVLKNKSADEAARIILKAMESWNMEVLSIAFHPIIVVLDKVEAIYKGLTIKSIGKAFRSGLYPGYFIPCEVELANGDVEELRIAIRNDNADGVWVIDGGL